MNGEKKNQSKHVVQVVRYLLNQNIKLEPKIGQ